MTASWQRDRQDRVVHAHLLAGAEWRLHDPQRPLTHDRLLYVIQRPFGRITSMPATGQKLPVSVAVEYSGKRTLTRRPAPGDPTMPLGIQRTYLSGATCAVVRPNTARRAAPNQKSQVCIA
jgi:hypothetical protein